MEILAKYIHGSEDSIDTDVYYVVDELPSFQECKAFCDSIKDENANLITIDNGVVTACYKGVPDECNNSLLETYSLHEQEYPLLVKYYVERDVFLKILRGIRIILSRISRTRYRAIVKEALKDNNLRNKMATLSHIRFNTIDFENMDKKESGKDILKVIAFQLGQMYGLTANNEYYTKSSIAKRFPRLKPLLYREDYADTKCLDFYLIEILVYLDKHMKENKDGIATFDDGSQYDVNKEKRIN